MKIQTGLDKLREQHFKPLRDLRVGLLCHHASVDSQVRHALDLLREARINVTALFGPEHGLWGAAQDQIEVSETHDARRGIPIYSLYADHRYPSQESLKTLDVLVCDLQDVGSRYYTFVWTLALAMQACAKSGKRVMVLDRPNPLGGQIMEGPVLDPQFASFVGLYPVPVRHGMTIGEIAVWLNDTFSIGCDLEIIVMRSWRRAMTFEKTGLSWVLPSPNMPTPDTAFVYPGSCLLEGTNLSEGRGTTRPFELLGAPFIDENKLADRLHRLSLPGVLFRTARFEPTFHKFQGQSCGGIQIHVSHRKIFRPFLTGLSIIQQIHDLYPDDFEWRSPPYEYETDKLPFDILCGTDRIRKAIETGRSFQPLEKQWQVQIQQFSSQRKPFLLYN